MKKKIECKFIFNIILLEKGYVMIGVTEEGLNWNSAQYFIYLNFVLLWFGRFLFGVNCSLITSLKLACRCHNLNLINKSTLYIVNLYHRIALKLCTFFSTDRRIRPPPCLADVPTKSNIPHLMQFYITFN